MPLTIVLMPHPFDAVEIVVSKGPLQSWTIDQDWLEYGLRNRNVTSIISDMCSAIPSLDERDLIQFHDWCCRHFEWLGPKPERANWIKEGF